MILMPPRHGKSELVSKYFPAWYLHMFPDNKIILASYEENFAASWGRKARDVLIEFGDDNPCVKVKNRYRAAASHWEIEGHDGEMTTAGVGGPVTGKGGHILVLDDPIKNAEQANSPTQRDSKWDWYQSTFYTRLEPGGAIILILTPWHHDDISGRLIKEMENGGDQWEILKLPAINDEGEALWPERYNIESLERTKKAVGSYYWSAMYQQKPQKDTGGIFKKKNFRYFRIDGDHYVLSLPEGKEKRFIREKCTHFQTVDTAMKTGTKNHYTVITTFALTPERDLLILDVHRDRYEVPEQYGVICAERKKYRLAFQAVEEKASGIGLIQQAKRDGHPFKILKADQDKIMRATPASVAYENGMIYHRSGASFLDESESELLAFPVGEFDDFVDTVSYGQLLAQDMRVTPAQPVRPKMIREMDEPLKRGFERPSAMDLPKEKRQSKLSDFLTPNRPQ